MRTLRLIVITGAIAFSVAGCTRGGKVDAVNAEMIPLKDKVITGYVTGKGGVKLFVRIEGNGSPTLVLPGGPGYSFDYLLPVLSDLDSSNQMIYFDPRGCGRSDRFKNPALYTLDNMVADVESLRTHSQYLCAQHHRTRNGGHACAEIRHQIPYSRQSAAS